MVINVDKLATRGVVVRAFRNDESYKMPPGIVIELFFEHGQFPKELHEAVHHLMPNMKMEANVVAEGTMSKINDFLIVEAINADD